MKRIDNLIRESMLVEAEDAKEAGTLGYMARAMVQATMPHSDPKTNYFERTNGLVTLSIMSKPNIGLPYGSMPRILLAWVCTEAKKTKSATLLMGRSQAEFLQKLNMRSEGRYISTLKDQAHRLFSSLITLSGEKGDELGIENVLIAKRSMLFWNPRKPDQQSLWESSMTLTAEFFDEVTENAVPIDLRVLHALRKSPMAMDIYTWLTYRVFTMRVRNRPIVTIPWERLQAQIGSGYGVRTSKDGLIASQVLAVEDKALRNFKTKFLLRLKEVLIFYPEAMDAISWDSKGLTIKRAALHIKSSQFALGAAVIK